MAAVALCCLTAADAQELTETLSPTSDVSLRSDKATTPNATAKAIEMYTQRDDVGTITKDFVGLMAFDVPVKAGYRVKQATLRLVTERAKGTMAIYGFDATVSDADTYESQSASIAAARTASSLATVLLAGTSGKAVFDAGASSALTDWVNNIDLTSYVKQSGSQVNLLLANNANSTTTSIQVYSSDAVDVTNTNEGFTFAAADLKSVLTVVYEVDASQVTSVQGATADTYLRMGNTVKRGAEATVEVLTDLANSKDFVGLLSFAPPVEVTSGEYTMQQATLRLVTERCKGVTSMSLYPYGHDFSEDAIYADETSYVDAARKETPVTFNVAFGVRGKSLVLDDISASPDLSAWTNTIDVTSLAKSATTGTLNLLLASADGNGNSNKFFTKETGDVTNAKNESYTYAAADLVPQLTVVCAKAETTGVTEVKHAVAPQGIYTLQGVKVERPLAKGVYIIDGKKMLVK